MNKFILVDGNAIIHRSFHALPPFKTSTGELVNAVYGFASVLLNLLNMQKPDYIAVAFDLKGPTFRHAEYKEYKATRVKAPDELYAQIPRIKELVKAFHIPIFEQQGFEADDIIGTLATQAESKSMETFIVTGDLDTLQLVTEHTKVLTLLGKFSEPLIYDAAKVMDRYGLTPSQITDMKGLQGDNSDNIKGVAGVGQKTTKDLLQEYGSIENIYENLPNIKESIRKKLEADKDNAFQSKMLATIICDMDIELDLDACAAHEYDEEALRQIFQDLEFTTLLKRLDQFHKHSSIKRSEDKQSTLF